MGFGDEGGPLREKGEEGNRDVCLTALFAEKDESVDLVSIDRVVKHVALNLLELLQRVRVRTDRCLRHGWLKTQRLCAGLAGVVSDVDNVDQGQSKI